MLLLCPNQSNAIRTRGHGATNISSWRRSPLPVARRRIAAGTEQVRSLIVKAKRLHWGDHRSAATTRNEQRLLTHLARQRARERMLE